MKNKIVVVLVVVCFVMVVLGLVVSRAISTDNIVDNKQIGRYQLFQGTYNVINMKSGQMSQGPGVFLLDTMTGKVKQFNAAVGVEGTSKGFSMGWVDTEQ